MDDETVNQPPGRVRKALGTTKTVAAMAGVPYLTIAASTQLHEGIHALTAGALGVPPGKIKVDAALGPNVAEAIRQWTTGGHHEIAALTAAQHSAASSHFNQALIDAAPNVLGLAGGAGLMTYGLRHRKPAVFAAGLTVFATHAQYAVSELLQRTGDFSRTGYHLMMAADEKLHCIPPHFFNDERYANVQSLVGVAAISGAAYLTYKIPSAVAVVVRRMREARRRRMSGGRTQIPPSRIQECSSRLSRWLRPRR